MMTQSNLTFTESHEIPEGYKLSDLGQCPLTWEVKPVKDIAKVIDSLHMTPSFSNDGYPMVRVADIKTGNLDLSSTLKVNRHVFLNFIRNYKPQKNDIVLSRVGSYGVSSFVATEEEFCIGQNTVVIKSNINAKYLYYALNSKTTWQQIENGSFGSGYKSLSLKNINELKIYVPEILEQQKITTALSDTDALISELEKLIEKKQAIKTATMQQLLTGKTRLPEFVLREDGTPKGYKGSELGQIPEDWEIKSYGEIFKFLSTANNARDDLSEEGDYSYIHYGDIHTKLNECIDCEKVNFPMIDKEKVSSVFVKSGDLIMADASEDYAGIGKSIEVINVNTKIVAGLHTFLLRDENQYYINGFKAYLHLIPKVKKSMDRLATGLKVYSLSKTVLKTILLPVPLKEEQSAIVAFLNDMNLDIDISEQKLEKLKLIKQGMMQELLTGKTRLV